MNNFDLVLTTIKEHCKETNVPNKECFEKVKAGLEEKDQSQLDFYLDFLQDLGLIQYSGSNKLIVLTERGKYTSTLFS